MHNRVHRRWLAHPHEGIGNIMLRKSKSRPLARLLAFCSAPMLAACATSDFDPSRVVGQPEASPERFLVGLPNGSGTRETKGGEGCLSPMVDPRSSLRITMVRSSLDRGDYAVPEGAYGLERGQLLRLDCTTGRVIGVVAR